MTYEASLRELSLFSLTKETFHSSLQLCERGGWKTGVTQGGYGIPVLGIFLYLSKVMADLVWCWWWSQPGWKVQPMTSNSLQSSSYFAASSLSFWGTRESCLTQTTTCNNNSYQWWKWWKPQDWYLLKYSWASFCHTELMCWKGPLVLHHKASQLPVRYE